MPDVKAMRAQQAYLEQQVQSLDLNDELTQHSDSLVGQLRRTKTVQKTEDTETEERVTRLLPLQVGFQKLQQDN